MLRSAGGDLETKCGCKTDLPHAFCPRFFVRVIYTPAELLGSLNSGCAKNIDLHARIGANLIIVVASAQIHRSFRAFGHGLNLGASNARVDADHKCKILGGITTEQFLLVIGIFGSCLRDRAFALI